MRCNHLTRKCRAPGHNCTAGVHGSGPARVRRRDAEHRARRRLPRVHGCQRNRVRRHRREGLLRWRWWESTPQCAVRHVPRATCHAPRASGALSLCALLWGPAGTPTTARGTAFGDAARCPMPRGARHAHNMCGPTSPCLVRCVRHHGRPRCVPGPSHHGFVGVFGASARAMVHCAVCAPPPSMHARTPPHMLLLPCL